MTLDALRSGALAGARELRLTACGLRSVPPEIFALADTLEVLDLGGNALTDLPPEMGRLTKMRALFCSGNPMPRLPPALGDCPALSQVGFRGCRLVEVPAESLPPRLRWLTLTDNRIEFLPAALGERPALQKLMLAGNRLRDLPDSLAQAPNLELLRISANRFDAVPPWLGQMPRLAWLAMAGNPLDGAAARTTPKAIAWSSLRLGELLGEGASGRTFRAVWRQGDCDTPVAVKLFKGVMTSDGLPECEMAACLAAGPHPHLAGGLGFMSDHPEGTIGLVMPLLPAELRVLAGPPSLASCSRDVYSGGLRFDRHVALAIARGTAAAAAHLHAQGLLHGDLYAHNILWDQSNGAAVLSDFGAAAFMPDGPADRLQRLDVLAWGILFGELGDRCDDLSDEAGALLAACMRPDPSGRPAMADVVAALDAMIEPARPNEPMVPITGFLAPPQRQ